MLEQHYYTRAKSGVFRSSEGFDTIAKSEGLRNDFIKKSIHPFCKYDSPLELQKASEKDEEKFPKSLLFTYSQNGDLIIGQYKYLDKDLGSNSRNAFFAHHYIIYSNYKDDIEDIIKDVRKILYLNNFKETIAVEEGKTIPSMELSQIEYDKSIDILSNKEMRLAKLGIDEELFKKLLYATIMSISTKKKVYIALDVVASEIANKAREVLGFILSSLPYDLRRKVGFLTYARQPEGKKGINIMFVEKGSINLSDRTIARDYIFDFENKRFENLDDAKGYYLDFAWSNVHIKEKMESFFEYSERIKQFLSEDEKINIENFNKLSMFFEFDYGNTKVYEDNKGYMLNSAIEYIKKVKDSSISGRLNTKVYEMLNKEYIDITERIREYIPEISLINSFINYFSIVDNDEIKKKINIFILYAINNGNNASNAEYVSSIFKTCEANKEIFKRLIETIFQYPDLVRGIFYKYLDERFSKAKNLKSTIQEIKFWIETYEDILNDGHFRDKTTENILELMRKSQNKISDNKIIITTFNSGLNVKLENATKLNVYINQIKEQCDNILLNSIQLETITKLEIEIIEFSRENSNTPYKIIKIAKEIFSTDDINEKFIKKKVSYELANSEDELKGLIKRCLKNDIIESNFYKIIYAFEDYNSYEFDNIIDYIKTAGKQKVYDFIEWAFENKLFLKGGADKPETKFAKAIANYFLAEDKEAIRDKELRKRFKKYSKLDELMGELEYETSIGINKIFLKYKKVIAIAGVAVLCVCAIATIAFTSYEYLGNNLYKNNNKKNVTSNSDKKKNSNKKGTSGAKVEANTNKTKTAKSGVKNITNDLNDELIDKIGKGYTIIGNVEVLDASGITIKTIMIGKKVVEAGAKNGIELKGSLVTNLINIDEFKGKNKNGITVKGQIQVKDTNGKLVDKDEILKKVLNDFFFDGKGVVGKTNNEAPKNLEKKVKTKNNM